MLVAILLAAGGSAQARTPAALTVQPSTSSAFNGCGEAKLAPDHWLASIRALAWTGEGASRSCPRSAGGPNVTSAADVASSVVVVLPVNLSQGVYPVAGGANVTWHLALNASDVAPVLPAAACPRNETQSSQPLRRGGWFNTTDFTVDCVATATVSVAVTAYLTNLNASGYYAAVPFWRSNFSGASYVGEDYWDNYSARSLWIDNFSMVDAVANVSSPTGSLPPSFSVTLRIAGNFTLAGPGARPDQWELVTSVTFTAATEVVGFGHAAAHARILPGAAGYEARLAHVTVW